MPSDKDKDELLTTPLENAPRTTPYKTPPVSGETPPDLPDGSLSALRQRYDILAELGRGGMGIVYRARDRETGDVVALKVLRPEIAARPEVIERFKSELLLARKITHKNVCRTYELLRFGDTVAIAMEYVEGESLRSLLSRVEGLSVRQGLKILRQMITGLAEAHAQGVLHRDLKPENIVITRDGNVKVMDFGIARSIEAEATQTSSIVGTPAYMSPEQAEGKPVDARTDVYALGLILYEIFTGRLPFHADTPVGLVHKQIHETPPPARSVDPYLPVFLERAIEKCLEKNPKKRFESVAELEAALEEQALPELPEGEPVPAPHLSVWGKRDWALLVLGVLGLFYFLEFRNTVFPAAKMPIEVDAITARRAAEDLAARLGRPFPALERAQLVYQGERYWGELVPPKVEYFLRSLREVISAYWRTPLPVYWKLTFSSPTDPALAVAERYALVDRAGKVQELSSPYPPGWLFPNYQVPPVEQRRKIAREVVESTCGALPADAVLTEFSGGEQGAAYTASFRPLRPMGSPRLAEVSLLAEKVIRLDCKPRQEAPPGLTRDLITSLLVQDIARIWLLVGLVWLMVHFGIGRCYLWPTLWKRLPLAVILGLAAVWVVAPTFNQPPNTAVAGPAPSFLLIVGGGLAAAGLFLVGLVTAESYSARRTPGAIASYILAWRGRFSHPAVGLAVVRGALAGVVLASVGTLGLHLVSLLAMRRGLLTELVWLFTGGLVDPTALGQAAASFSPPLFVLAATILAGLTLGLVVIGGLWAIQGYKEWMKYRTDKVHRSFILWGTAISVALVAAALRLPLGQTLGIGFGFVLFPAILLFLGLVLLFAYDVLTLVMALGTAVLWTLNYPLLQILQEVGNGGEWAVFIGWGLLVAAAAVVAFRGELARAVQRAKAEMQ